MVFAIILQVYQHRAGEREKIKVNERNHYIILYTITSKYYNKHFFKAFGAN